MAAHSYAKALVVVRICSSYLDSADIPAVNVRADGGNNTSGKRKMEQQSIKIGLVFKKRKIGTSTLVGASISFEVSLRSALGILAPDVLLVVLKGSEMDMIDVCCLDTTSLHSCSHSHWPVRRAA